MSQLPRLALPALLAGLLACGGDRQPVCGFTAMAGATMLLNEFTVPNQVLSKPPANLPERLVVRLAAGPAYPAVVGRSESGWLVGVEGSLPAGVRPGFGALVLDLSGAARGVVLYEAEPVQGAPSIGTVALGDTTVPLLGIQLDPAKVEDPRCPLFPDSVIR